MKHETIMADAAAGKPEGAAGSRPPDVLDRFISVIAHDLRGSIRALKELPGWIADDLSQSGAPPSEEVGDYLAMLKVHAERLDRYVVDLLSYSRIGRMQNVVRVDLPELVERLIAADSRFEMNTVLQDLDKEHLSLGETDSERLVSSLLINAAVHAGPDAEIQVGSRIHDGALRLWVEDNGPGIPPQYREKALEPMSTLQPRDAVEGSGMGLAIARKVAETYGGSLRLMTPDSGQGLRVEVAFPAAMAG